MSWGKRILFLYLSFVALMTCMVILSFRQNTQLVTSDYYADELIFQQIIDASNNARIHSDSIFIKVEQEHVILIFPVFFNEGVIGEVYFYKASDATSDIKTPLVLNVNAIQQFEKEMFKPGFYTVKLRWMKGDVEYYLEKNILL